MNISYTVPSVIGKFFVDTVQPVFDLLVCLALISGVFGFQVQIFIGCHTVLSMRVREVNVRVGIPVGVNVEVLLLLEVVCLCSCCL